MAYGWNSYTLGRRAQWLIPLLAAVLAMVMVPVIGVGASSAGAESVTQRLCPVQIDRLGGSDRYATAVAISKFTFPGGAGTVFIATGENFPDALAASTLAHTLGGPVLLTRTGSLPGVTINEIKRLNATKIKILGGAAAVQPQVENALKSLGTVTRIWGNDRYSTAVQISKAAFPNPASVDRVYVAIGTSFPDALGAAPVGALASAPLLLTGPTSLSGSTRREILRLDPTSVIVVGGGIGSSVQNAISALGPAVTTIAGNDRFATAVDVSVHGFPLGASTVFIVRGSTFPDALAGGVAAADAGGPILLVNETAVPVSVVDELNRLNPSRIVILGGTAAVSDLVERSMATAVCGATAPTTTVPGGSPTLPPTTTVVPTSTTTTAPTTTTTTVPPTTTTTAPPPPDTTKPIITVVGANPLSVPLNATYTDPGATASDDVDGDITGNIVILDSVDTSVAGEYTVTYDVMDAAGNPAIRRSRTVNVVVIKGIAQLNHFLTGYKGPDSVPENKLTVPATDPAGIAYHAPSGRLFIADSEISEPNLSTAFAASGGNVFETSLDGSILYNVYDLNNDEPTGIAYDATDDVFYVTNDDANRLYRYSFTAGVGFTLEDSISTAAAGYNDVEGVTVDGAGNIYVIVQIERTILVYSYNNSFTLDRTMDLAALNPGDPVPTSPEGIAYDAATGDLFVVSQKNLPNAIYRYTTGGSALGRFSLGSFSPLPAFGTAQHNQTAVDTPQGLVFAPSSSGSGTSLYIADGGLDNGSGATTDERDGVIYEASFS